MGAEAALGLLAYREPTPRARHGMLLLIVALAAICDSMHLSMEDIFNIDLSLGWAIWERMGQLVAL